MTAADAPAPVVKGTPPGPAARSEASNLGLADRASGLGLAASDSQRCAARETPTCTFPPPEAGAVQGSALAAEDPRVCCIPQLGTRSAVATD